MGFWVSEPHEHRHADTRPLLLVGPRCNHPLGLASMFQVNKSAIHAARKPRTTGGKETSWLGLWGRSRPLHRRQGCTSVGTVQDYASPLREQYYILLSPLLHCVPCMPPSQLAPLQYKHVSRDTPQVTANAAEPIKAQQRHAGANGATTLHTGAPWFTPSRPLTRMDRLITSLADGGPRQPCYNTKHYPKLLAAACRVELLPLSHLTCNRQSLVLTK